MAKEQGGGGGGGRGGERESARKNAANVGDALTSPSSKLPAQGYLARENPPPPRTLQ